MRTKLIVTLAAAGIIGSMGVVLARNANSGPVYPSTASNQSYADHPIADHANRAPRYAATASGQPQAQPRHIEDHANRAPRYPSSASSSAASASVRYAHRRHMVHVHHRTIRRG